MNAELYIYIHTYSPMTHCMWLWQPKANMLLL